jgi:hypothetical protein
VIEATFARSSGAGPSEHAADDGAQEVCPFVVGDVVFDDVFKKKATVTELPRADEPELDRRGKVFDPVFAVAECVHAEIVKGLAALPCFENLDALIAGMIVEIPKYMPSASSLRLDRTDVAEFSKGVLQFWRSHATEMTHWAEAARIVFSMAHSSAACEGVFSLLALMFDTRQRQRSALMDFVSFVLS